MIYCQRCLKLFSSFHRFTVIKGTTLIPLTLSMKALFFLPWGAVCWNCRVTPNIGWREWLRGRPFCGVLVWVWRFSRKDVYHVYWRIFYTIPWTLCLLYVQTSFRSRLSFLLVSILVVDRKSWQVENGLICPASLLIEISAGAKCRSFKWTRGDGTRSGPCVPSAICSRPGYNNWSSWLKPCGLPIERHHPIGFVAPKQV